MLKGSDIHFRYYTCYTIYKVILLVVNLNIFPSQYVDYALTCETGFMSFCNYDYAQQLDIFHTENQKIV